MRPDTALGFHLAACLVVNEERHVLLVHRFDPAYDHWELPGGKVQSNEEPSAAAVRELAEEVGLQLSQPRVAHSVEFFDRGAWNRCSIVVGTIVGEGSAEVREPELFDGVGYWPTLSICAVDFRKSPSLAVLLSTGPTFERLVSASQRATGRS